MTSNVQLLLGDCLEILPEMKTGSIDAILTDLPYGTTACAWDTVIPFEPMWAAVKRVLKPRGVFVTTASQPFTSALVMSNVEWFKYEWVWDKRNAPNFASVKYAPLKAHEQILVFSHNGHTYNPQLTGRAKHPFGKLTLGHSETAANMDAQGNRGIGYPKTIIEYMRPNNLTGGGLHPTQKPVALYEYLTLTYTNPGDTVLDFCAGSGTTGVACIKTGRNFIGIEKREDYFAIMSKRIREAQQQMVMPL